FVDIHGHVDRWPVRREQAVHERLQSVGFLDDDPRVLPQARPVQLTLQKLRRAAQATEGILDLVGEVSDQLPVCTVLGHALLFALDAKALVDRAELQQKRRVLELNRRHDAVEVQRFLAREGEDQVRTGEAVFLAARLVQKARQRTGIDEEPGKRLMEDGLAAGREQRFRGWVEIFDSQRAI